jgi:hypothetical protein
VTPCNCPKEYSPQSLFSPVATNSSKIIADDEVVLRIVREPTEWKDDNFTHCLFSKQDIQNADRGLSVCRKNYTSSEKIIALNTKLVVGAFAANCSAIRELTAPVLQPVCLIDDGTENDIAHALIVRSVAIDVEIPNKWRALLGEIERVFGYTPPNRDMKKLRELF